MWVALGHKHFVLKREKSKDDCSISISDFVRIWTKRLKNEEIAAICKELNPLIEAPKLKLVEKVWSLLDGNTGTAITVDEHEDHLILHLESNLSGIKFNFRFTLEVENGDMLFKKITLPFILSLARLQMRENKLIEIIKKKDAEIIEYRRECNMIKRSHLITKEFNLRELAEAELEMTESVLAIRKNPSLIFGILDMNMFNTLHENVTEENEIVDKMLDKNFKSEMFGIENSVVLSKNELNKKKTKTTVKCKKLKSKIGVQITSSAKKKRSTSGVNLRL